MNKQLNNIIIYPKENDNWYKKVYNSIIENAKSRGLDKSNLDKYYEKHHIIPKCLGGDNNKDNLVLLTAKEHFIAHRILYRLHPDNNKLLLAVIAMMSPGNKSNHRENIKLRSSTIAFYRELHAQSLRGKHHSEETKRKISEGNKGKKLSAEQINYLKKINTGRHPSEETRKKMSIAHSKENLTPEIIDKIRKSSTGRRHTEETKRKISEANKGKVRPIEWCENISKGKTGKPGHKHTESTKQKMSQNSPRNLKIMGPDGTIYNSMKNCAEINKIHRDTLRNWIKNNPEKGFKYYDDK